MAQEPSPSSAMIPESNMFSRRDMEEDMSRADMMTPFSLSLAAEKAIENAKRQLDAMDGRLLKARMAMARAQSHSAKLTTPPSATPSFFQDPNETSPVEKSKGDDDKSRWEGKAIEMRRLREDLSVLRGRMNIARGLESTLLSTTSSNSTTSTPTTTTSAATTSTPPPRRPVRPDGFDIRRYSGVMDTQDVIHAFPSPPEPGSRVSSGFVVMSREAPFSPRPYSSQSMMSPQINNSSSTTGIERSESREAFDDQSLVRARVEVVGRGKVVYSGYHTPPNSSPQSHVTQRWSPGSSGSSSAPLQTNEARPAGDVDGLRGRLESALSRIDESITRHGSERQKRKLAAALAILEDSDGE